MSVTRFIVRHGPFAIGSLPRCIIGIGQGSRPSAPPQTHYCPPRTQDIRQNAAESPNNPDIMPPAHPSYPHDPHNRARMPSNALPSPCIGNVLKIMLTSRSRASHSLEDLPLYHYIGPYLYIPAFFSENYSDYTRTEYEVARRPPLPSNCPLPPSAGASSKSFSSSNTTGALRPRPHTHARARTRTRAHTHADA